MEKKLEDLKAACTDMRKEIQSRQMEAKNLKEELDKKNRAIQKASKEYEAVAEDVEKLKVSPSNTQVTWAPCHLRSQAAQLHCLFNSFLRPTLKKILKLCIVMGICRWSSY